MDSMKSLKSKSVLNGRHDNEMWDRTSDGGWNSSVGNVLGLLPCATQCCRFDPPLCLSLRYRVFFLAVNIGSDSIP